MKKALLISGLLFSVSVAAKTPDCHSWPMNMAEVWLKNEKIVDINQLDEPKTEFKLLASEKKKEGLYTQVSHFVFHDKHGKSYNLITQSDATQEECSASEVNVFQVSKTAINH
ncbi:hypothetical protein N5923_11595 [Erwiniaceae bacterium BAC15a-03b]|uniref:Uncharacterized protein n=1 Tax=Winslowiella arboricola TaxID=2978220 RepID=A0A9J6PMY2_9GAMM|nr:hypothetical protein [Winslowiella arboricola]MCU5771071.1 hypothetical protein [Winslowiella arboricola]MCU5778134.1 hypothetical protein [Winslowiella arboricola]